VLAEHDRGDRHGGDEFEVQEQRAGGSRDARQPSNEQRRAESTSEQDGESEGPPARLEPASIRPMTHDGWKNGKRGADVEQTG